MADIDHRAALDYLLTRLDELERRDNELDEVITNCQEVIAASQEEKEDNAERRKVLYREFEILREKVAAEEEEAPASSGTEVEEEKIKKFGAYNPVIRLLDRTILEGEYVPTSLEAALEVNYGEDWRDRRIGLLGEPGGGEYRTDEAKDTLRQHLATTYRHLRMVDEEDYDPEVTRPTQRLSKLWKRLQKKGVTLQDLKGIFKAWGVKLD